MPHGALEHCVEHEPIDLWPVCNKMKYKLQIFGVFRLRIVETPIFVRFHAASKVYFCLCFSPKIIVQFMFLACY